MRHEPEDIVIVGAGVGGLTLAERLTARGAAVTVIEREAAPGGLARSVEIAGGRYDLGPHRFYSGDAGTMAYILDVLGDNADWIERKTSVFLKRRFHTWPITHHALLSLPLRDILHTAGDLLTRRGREAANFEDFVIGHYGPTLYQIFFKPITEKLFRRPCTSIHREWGIVSVDRAIIDKSPSVDSLTYLVRRLLWPEPPLRFAYPKKGGIQAFSDALVERLERRPGFRLLLGREVVGAQVADNRVAALRLLDGAEVPVGTLVWTAPLDTLSRLAAGRPAFLPSMSTVFYYFVTDPPSPRREQWIYVPDAAYRTMRVTLQGNFYRDADAPRGLCAEVAATAEEPILHEPQAFADGILAELREIGIVPPRARVVERRVVAVPETYPLYTIDYPAQLERALDRLGGLKNVFPVGRGGMFVYNNMDNSVKASIELDKWLQSQDEPPTKEAKKRWILAARGRC